jgi:hemolysin III
VNRFERLSVVLYLFLGWTILVAIDPLFMATSPPAIVLLATGGILYSVGVLFHLWKRLAYQQPIWHGFVAAGAACHYAAVLGEIALPGTFA